jgi:Flp pilus assembly protein TadG
MNLLRKRRGHAQKGQALLEIALVTPLILALALGVIELGRYAYIAILVGSAARAGAAYGAQNLTYAADPAAIKQAAISDFQNNGQPATNLNVNATVVCGCDSDGTISMQTTLCSAQADGNIGNTISACSNGGGHWAVMVSVEASGTFNSLFDYPGIPKSITVDRTATMMVAQQ